MDPRPSRLLCSLALAALLGLAPRAAAQPTVAPGATVSGALSAGDPVLGDGSHYDLYRLAVTAGGEYTVTMRSRDFDAYLAVGENGGGSFEALHLDDDGAGGTDSRVTFTAPSSGALWVRANSLRSGVTGAYTLSVAGPPSGPSGGGGGASQAARTRAAMDLLATMDTEETLRATTEASIQGQIDRQPMLAEYEDIMRDFMGRALRWEDIRDEYARIYADVYTEDELRQLRAFYQTPLGRRLIETTPEISVLSGALGERRMQEFMPAMQEEIARRMMGGDSGSSECNGSGAPYAAGAPWYDGNEPIVLGKRRYVKYGLPRVLGAREVEPTSSYRGVTVFAEAGYEGTPEVVYVPVRPSCEFQPYQMQMVGASR